jgi:23S rRNA (adenine2503-C2)-methyltransferase
MTIDDPNDKCRSPERLVGKVTEKIDLLNFDRAALAKFFVDQGEKKFRADQLIQWVHQHGVVDFSQMTNMSKSLRLKLIETAEFTFPEVVRDEISNDGTRKWLFRLQDGNCIETVFIPETDRATLCISSQAGCILDCSFCATAKQGFNRNLTTSEIMSQVWLANDYLGGWEKSERVISNVVFMGMGEPLYNYRQVIPALKLLLDDMAYGLSRRRVTISTAGVVPHIDKLSQECDVALAVSLHAPNDSLRNELVPLNQRYPLEQLLAACRRYVDGKPRRKITFEYVMLDGVNDQPSHANELIRLLKDVPAKINLIPFNPFQNIPYKCTSRSEISRFSEQLQRAGLVTTVRKTRGDDIDAACGQLAGKVKDRIMRGATGQINEIQVAVQ